MGERVVSECPNCGCLVGHVAGGNWYHCYGCLHQVFLEDCGEFKAGAHPFFRAPSNRVSRDRNIGIDTRPKRGTR